MAAHDRSYDEPLLSASSSSLNGIAMTARGAGLDVAGGSGEGEEHFEYPALTDSIKVHSIHSRVVSGTVPARTIEDEESPQKPEQQDSEPESYMKSIGGDEYDREQLTDKEKARAADTRPRVSHSWRFPTLALFVTTLGAVIIFLICEYAIEIDPTSKLCGHNGGGFEVIQNGFLSQCFREAALSLPYCASLIGFFVSWLVAGPWLVPRQRGRPVTLFFVVKMGTLVIATLLPLARLMVRAFEFTYTRPDDPLIFSTMDIIHACVWFLCSIVVVHDWTTGLGHRMFIRYFWWMSLVDSTVKVTVVLTQNHGGFDVTDYLYPASFGCNVILSVLAIMGWKEGKYEIWGNNRVVKVKSRGFPPFGQVWALMRPDLPLMSLGLLLSACQGLLLSLALTATAGLMGGDVASQEDATSQLKVFLGYSSAVACSTMIQQAIFGITGQRVKKRMKDLMFKNFLLQDTTFLHRKENDTGRLTSRLLTDTERFGTSVTTQLSAVMRPLSQGFIGTGFLFRISWRLTAVVFMMSIILMITSVLRSSLITVKYSRLYSDQLARVASRGVEVIKGIECVHQYQQEKNEHTSFVNSLQKVYYIGTNKETREACFEGLEYFMLATVLGTGLWYGSVLVLRGDLTKEELITFALITAAVNQSIEAIMKIVPEFLDVAGPALRVCQLVNSRVTWDFDKPERGDIPDKLDGKIKFDNIQFYYPGAHKKTLGPGLTFTVKGGESVALVGESGCGKSTCISLVQRQYHVKGLVDGCKPKDVGGIEVDGKDIRELNRHWVMERIGVVAQRAIMWNTTILDNVAYGSAAERWIADGSAEREAQRVRVIQALDQAAAWNEFVNPDPPLRADGSKPTPGLGLYFQVGEDGCNLSGGQKQRISIARMIYKNPSLFIFDEVTSALDAGSEKNVMRTLVDISSRPVKKTCLMIAHRLNTIKHADHIIVLSKAGNIMEETWTRVEAADGTELKGDAATVAGGEEKKGSGTPTSSGSGSGDSGSAAIPLPVVPDGARLVTAHEQLLRNASGYYRRMWDDQTF